ncbi:MAG: glutamate--cysteine ligase [Burkholderiales bacterium]
MLAPERVGALPPGTLNGIQRGVEKESLRVRPDGALAVTPHPAALGSALTHASITTDFSESQLELITGVDPTPEACVRELTEIHQAVYRAIGDELLWAGSMPCNLPREDAIPLGQYGTSNVGRAKTVYRTGLSHRYGRRMQTISGIHYNFSLPQNPGDDAYFALIRNFRRHSWLLLYLFGASPAVCACFLEGREHALERLSPSTFYLPYATSLRMGRLGYQSDAQSALSVSYNSLETYGASLEAGLTRVHPPYEAIGVRAGDDYRQLATTLLQIENEFYGTIRPKRRIFPGERPLHALRERGVEYIEVRLIDLDPFLPVGIDEDAMRMLDVFLLYCHLCDSPPDTQEELAQWARNRDRVASRGREPGLRLLRGNEEATVPEWAGDVLRECAPIAVALDAANGGAAYTAALDEARARVADPARTPSARVLEAMARDYADSYSRFVLAQSQQHREAILALPYPDALARRFADLAEKSLAKQREIEANDTMPFELYRQRYLDPARLRV